MTNSMNMVAPCVTSVCQHEIQRGGRTAPVNNTVMAAQPRSGEVVTTAVPRQGRKSPQEMPTGEATSPLHTFGDVFVVQLLH